MFLRRPLCCVDSAVRSTRDRSRLHRRSRCSQQRSGSTVLTTMRRTRITRSNGPTTTLRSVRQVHGSARLCILQSQCSSRFTSMVAPTAGPCMILPAQHPVHIYTSLADQTWTSDRACSRAIPDMNAYSL